MPVPHWGLALRVDQFHDLAARVKAGGIAFEIEPHLRFKGARLGPFIRRVTTKFHGRRQA